MTTEEYAVIPDEVLTVKEVADLFKVSRVTVWRWCQQGTLSAFKVGRGWRVRREEVERVMRQNPERHYDPAHLKGETVEERMFPVLM